ncbi:hypothetical protein C8Q76DRAFT_59310 [Earliella scabrosa]|nr:hypothetical protein C8Q76DRAFT_59310 [Earliella scabrosa]
MDSNCTRSISSTLLAEPWLQVLQYRPRISTFLSWSWLGRRESHLHYDIFEHIMDTIGNAEEAQCATLAACARVSRTWLARARFNLYRRIRLADRESVEQLLRTIRCQASNESSLVFCTEELEISPPAQYQDYLPFALLSPYLPTLRHLHLGPNIEWQRYPPLYHSLGRYFRQVLRLTH